MVTFTICCQYCGSKELVRNGYAPNGKQRYRCKTGKRQSRENPSLNGYTEERREEIIRSYQERSSMHARTDKDIWCIEKHRPSLAEKKAAQLPPLRDTLVTPDPNDDSATILDLDELWSFVLKRRNQVWIWIALCRKTRQVVARAVGDRSKETGRELWNNVADEYRQGHCFADFWKAYQAVIPEKQRTQVGKETGETAHVERWNCTLPTASWAFCP